MGIMRTLYREVRLILGFSAPPETDTQIAERIASEVKGDIGGKKSASGEDWVLDAKFQGRETKILFDGAGRRVVIQIQSTLEGGPLFVIVAGNAERETPDGETRKPVTSGLNAQGPARDVEVMLDLWKALPTGARGNLSSLLAKHRAEFRYEDGLVRFDPEAQQLDGPSAKYNVKSLLQTLYNLTLEMEKAWADL